MRIISTQCQYQSDARIYLLECEHCGHVARSPQQRSIEYYVGQTPCESCGKTTVREQQPHLLSASPPICMTGYAVYSPQLSQKP